MNHRGWNISWTKPKNGSCLIFTHILVLHLNDGLVVVEKPKLAVKHERDRGIKRVSITCESSENPQSEKRTSGVTCQLSIFFFLLWETKTDVVEVTLKILHLTLMKHSFVQIKSHVSEISVKWIWVHIWSKETEWRMNSPRLPGSDDAVVWSSDQYQLFDFEEVRLPLCGRKIKHT